MKANDAANEGFKADFVCNDVSRGRVVHRVLLMGAQIPCRSWRTVCGWNFGSGQYSVLDTVPADRHRCAICFKGDASLVEAGRDSSCSGGSDSDTSSEA